MAELPTPKFANINLDLVKLQAWIPQRVFATVGDTGYAQIFSLYENGTPYNSATVSNLNFRAIKPDNNMLDITNGKGFTAIEGEPNKFIFMVPKQTFAAEGRVECYFYIADADGNTVASTTHFFYDVQRSVPSETDSISYIASLEDVVKSAKDLETQAMGMITEITANKNQTDKDATDFAVDLKLKQQDAEKQVDQMLADVKATMDKTAGDATDYQTKLDNLNKQYLTKYNELLSQLPNASDAVQQKIGDALAKVKADEQEEFQQISTDWAAKKEELDKSIDSYKTGVQTQLDSLKSQIAGISGETVSKLAKQIDDLQTKLSNLNLADYYTKKEIDDKLSSYQPSVDLSGYETKEDANATYAKKTDIVAPDLSSYAKTADVAKTYETKEDASTHLTKATADETYAKKSDILAPDLSSYETSEHASDTYETKADAASHLTKETADETYAKKSDIVAPDLSSYSKTADVAKTYETKSDANETFAKKTDIPDLSGYETTAHASETYETKADAETNYAKKADIPAMPDLSDYAKKSDIPASPDLSGYETIDNADKTFAKKTDIPDVSGFETTAHASETYAKKTDIVAPDLSDYAKSEDIAKTYETKSDADQTYAKKTDIVAPDLSSYETKTDADATYAKKTDIPAMPDLSEYAKKSDIPSAPDLSSYETSAHASETYETKDDASSHITKEQADADYASKSDLAGYAKTTDIPDVSTFETKTDADNTYAKKTDIPAMPDLSTYLTKTDADKTYATNEKVNDLPRITNITVSKPNGKVEDLEASVKGANGVYLDLTGFAKTDVLYQYAKESELNSYQKTEDADQKYIQQVKVTKVQNHGGENTKAYLPYKGLIDIDLSEYRSIGDTMTMADDRYVAKSDAANFATKDDLKNLNTGSSTSCITSIAVNGVDQTVTNGKVDLKLSTPDMSDYLTNWDAQQNYVKQSDMPKSLELVTYMNSSAYSQDAKLDIKKGYDGSLQIETKKLSDAIMSSQNVMKKISLTDTSNTVQETYTPSYRGEVQISITDLFSKYTPAIYTYSLNEYGSTSYKDIRPDKDLNQYDATDAAFPCALQEDKSESGMQYESKNFPTIMIYDKNGNYYIGGHKIQFAD